MQAPRRRWPRMRPKPRPRVTSSISVEAYLNRLSNFATKSAPPNPRTIGCRMVRFLGGKEQEHPGQPLNKEDLEKPWTPVPSVATQKAESSKQTTSHLPAPSEPERPVESPSTMACPSDLSHLPWERLMRLRHHWLWVQGGCLKAGDPPKSKRPLILRLPHILGELKERQECRRSYPAPPIQPKTHRMPMAGPQMEKTRDTTTYPNPWLPNSPRVQRNGTRNIDHRRSIEPPEPDCPQQYDCVINPIREETDIPENMHSDQCKGPQVNNDESNPTTMQANISESGHSDQCEGPQPNNDEGNATAMQANISERRHSDQCEGPQPNNDEGNATTMQANISESGHSDQCEGPQPNNDEGNGTTMQANISESGHSDQCEGPQPNNDEGNATTMQANISERGYNNQCEGPRPNNDEGNATTMQANIFESGHSDQCEGPEMNNDEGNATMQANISESGHSDHCERPRNEQ
ncbi:hypothetical protein JRQ81_018866 [Phrynocephalus forsythii]|uniref:Uncharacterized protein n=1 Tax=Phrynocephalus forsythii TaxID=171643 RepID=A0A9Q1AZU8_9SAUR|nr:hypothetical protein JRQ81_018866 [Phrynocephalus forsythii]